jgi:hypothetical protein
VKHWVLGILFALFVVQVSYFLSVPALAGMLRDPWAIGSVLLFASLLASAALVRGRQLAIALLAALILRYVIAMF